MPTSAADTTRPQQPPGDAALLAAGLRLTVGRITRRLRQTHATGDVSLSGVSVLARLADAPDSPGALAEAERVRPQAMAATLGALEERGLVARGADPADGRRAVMSITGEGRRMLVERRSESLERLTHVLTAQFGPADRAALAAVLPLLDRLAEQL